MKIRSLALENFRRFRAPVRIDGLTDGLNLICEPNECGKSTIMEGMRAALFERHGGSSSFIKSLRPWGDETAPTVEMTFELDGAEWSVAKRFLQKPQVSLTGPGGQSFTSDAAEDKLQSLLGFERSGNRGADDESRGVLGLLWVEQGAALSLDGPRRIARETIQSVLAGEVGAVTGGKRAVVVAAAIDSALSEFRTLKAGQSTGRLLAAQQQLALAQRHHTEAQSAVDHFGEVLDQLAVAREERGRVERDASDPGHAEDEKNWTRDLDVARAAAGKLREAQARLGEATSRREQADARVGDRTRQVANLHSAKQALSEASDAVTQFAPEMEKAIGIEADRAAKLTTARKTLEAAELKSGKAKIAQRSFARDRALVAAFARLDAADAMAVEIDKLKEEITQSSITSDVVDELVEFQGRVAQTRAAMEAGAPILDVRLKAGAQDRVTLAGETVADGRYPILGPLTLDVAEVGAFTISPAESAGVAAETAHRRAAEDLAEALTRAGVVGIEAARASATHRRDVEGRLVNLGIRLESGCPADQELDIVAGLDALRTALHGLDRPKPPIGDSASLRSAAEDAEHAVTEARIAERAISEARDVAGDGLKAAELQGEFLAGGLRDAKARADEATLALDQTRTIASDESLADAANLALQAETRAAADVDATTAAAKAFSVEDLQRRLTNAATRRRNAEQERIRLAGEIGRLEEAARSEGERGPAADLVAACEAEDEAQATLARLTEEAEVLSLLRRVLADATRDATRLYLGPVTERVAPYIERLLPGATLELSEAMAAGSINRAGRTEPADGLSRGTQEQLAVLSRIAFADLLLEKGQPVSLMLDDALVYSDDGRLEIMTDILSEVAGRMQVIMLTCRKRAFLHLDATRVSLRVA